MVIKRSDEPEGELSGHFPSNEERRRSMEATVAITGKRYCSSGNHFATDEGEWVVRNGIRRFICAKCVKERMAKNR